MKKTLASFLAAAFLMTVPAMAASPAPKASAKGQRDEDQALGKTVGQTVGKPSAKPSAKPAPKATKKPRFQKTASSREAHGDQAPAKPPISQPNRLRNRRKSRRRRRPRNRNPRSYPSYHSGAVVRLRRHSLVGWSADGRSDETRVHCPKPDRRSRDAATRAARHRARDRRRRRRCTDAVGEDAEASLRLFVGRLLEGAKRLESILGKGAVKIVRLEKPLRVRVRFGEQRVSLDLDDVHQLVRITRRGSRRRVSI